jgi:hypothetical protein
MKLGAAKRIAGQHIAGRVPGGTDHRRLAFWTQETSTLLEHLANQLLVTVDIHRPAP